MAATRGLGVTSQDLEVSRLVFVSVRDAKPKRKVAVPVPDNGNWEQFIAQVQSKLKLAGVEAIYLASTGERVTQLDQLQDIDELHVVEAAAARPSSGQGNGYAASGGAYPQRVGVADAEITPAMSSQLDADSDYGSKYVKRQSTAQLTMKRVFPSLFSQQSLPVTTKDTAPLSPVEQVRRRIRKRRRSWTDPGAVLLVFALLSCTGTLLFVYLRASQGLP